jgi:hypothetical protein
MVLMIAAAVTVGEAVAQKGGRGGPPEQAGREQVGREPMGQNREPPAQDRGQPRHSRGADHRALSDAVRRVERRTGGQVLSAERVPFDGRNVNRVKVVDPEGRVRVYMDDPGSSRSPRLLPSRGESPRTRDDDG